MSDQTTLFTFTAPANIDGVRVPSRITGVAVTEAPEPPTTRDLIGRAVGEYAIAHQRNGEELRLADRDVPALVRGTVAVLALLLDMQPHTYEELRAATGLQSADRRVRDLRATDPDAPERVGFGVKVERCGITRKFTYRLLPFCEDTLTDAARALLKAARGARS